MTTEEMGVWLSVIAVFVMMFTAIIVAAIIDLTKKQENGSMSFEQKKLTKKQLIEKLHNERRAWMDRVEFVKVTTRNQTLAASRKVMDAVLSSVIRAFGTADGEAVRLDINVPEEREGYTWKTKIEVVDDKTWRLWAQEMKDPEPEEVQNESNEV